MRGQGELGRMIPGHHGGEGLVAARAVRQVADHGDDRALVRPQQHAERPAEIVLTGPLAAHAAQHSQWPIPGNASEDVSENREA